MQFGYFDNDKREYVITRPDTPAPWVNYLGSPEYGAIVSNNAGGYSFARSGANGRILRYVFNQFDQPGRYIYIRDNDSKDYWSASWQPVGKDLENYQSVCRHGTGYTSMEARYSGIESQTLFYVPLDCEYEVWKFKVKNTSDRPRSLTITGYAEFTNNSNYEQDQVNLQYSLFITSTHFKGNHITSLIEPNILSQAEIDGEECESSRFLGIVGADVSSYCGDKQKFLGRYRQYSNPIGIETGHLGNVTNVGENSCGALSTQIELEPGQEKEIAFLLGLKGEAGITKIMDHYQDLSEVCGQELEALITWWHGRLGRFQIKTPNPVFDTMLNTWNGYNCFMTFIWSRAASLIYCGLRNGYGYRDTVQDIQGIIHLAPEMAVEKIRFMLSAQVDNGGGLPLVKFTHNAGHEDTPDDASYVKETGHPAYRADDALWLFPTVYKYIAESGNLDFLNEVIPYANKNQDTVYEHLKSAIRFSMERRGPHGMPAGLHADWNDCLRLGAAGESSFVAFQFYYAMKILSEFALQQKDEAYFQYLSTEMVKLEQIINDNCWNEDRFIRGYTEDGARIGDRENPEASMWLNPQSWSVISRLAAPDQAQKAMESVHRLLNTEYGAILMDPPYHDHAFPGVLSICYHPGFKENAGIFSQSQGWLILAEALMGHGNRAFGYFLKNAPAAFNEKAELREMEPYCYGQFTEGKASPYFGRSHVHWLTGTASTITVGCVEGILGMRPDLNGLRIAPSIPSEWDAFEIEKDFRECHLHIRFENPSHVESGVKKLVVNGKEMSGDYVPVEMMSDMTEILVVMG